MASKKGLKRTYPDADISEGQRAFEQGIRIGGSSFGCENEFSFVDVESERKFSTYGKEMVAKVVNLESGFDVQGFDIGELLEYQGLQGFLSIADDIYPRYVKLFYSNIRYPRDENETIDYSKLTTFVGTSVLTFNESEFTKSIQIPVLDGVMNISSEFDIAKLIPGYNWQNAVGVICLNDNCPIDNLAVNNLKIACRIIHCILQFCLEGKLKVSDKLSRIEIFFVWAIFTRHRLNWPHYIYTKLCIGPNADESCLKYGYPICKFLRDSGVDVTGVETRKFRKDTDLLHINVLNNMGCQFIGGEWKNIEKKGKVKKMDKGKEVCEYPKGGPKNVLLEVYNSVKEIAMVQKDLQRQINIIRSEIMEIGSLLIDGVGKRHGKEVMYSTSDDEELEKIKKKKDECNSGEPGSEDYFGDSDDDE